MKKKTKAKEELSVAAYNALKEAKQRESLRSKFDLPKELGGREGPEPTRYGDWEKKGLTSDF